VAGVCSFGVAVSPNGSRVYVTDLCSNSISVIDATTNTIVATIPGIINPQGIAATPDGNRVYATNFSARAPSRRSTR
jgi:YVTN family beta-propeller protein